MPKIVGAPRPAHVLAAPAPVGWSWPSHSWPHHGIRGWSTEWQNALWRWIPDDTTGICSSSGRASHGPQSIRGEYVVKIESTSSTVSRFPLRSLRVTLNTGDPYWYEGSNPDVDGHILHIQEAVPLPTPSTNGQAVRLRPRQIYGLYFLNHGGKFKASCTEAPWAPREDKVTHFTPEDWRLVQSLPAILAAL